MLQWLERVFGKERVPPFEVNDHTIGYLHALALLHEEREHQAQQLTKVIQASIIECEAEGERSEVASV